jgi:hypothetical protein
MYQMLTGVSAADAAKSGEEALKEIGLTPGDFWRLRNIGVTEYQIEVYCRMGGGNRQCDKQGTLWDFILDVGPGEAVDVPDNEDGECTCGACTMQRELPKNSYFISDTDDEYDNTYNTIVFLRPSPDKSQEQAT